MSMNTIKASFRKVAADMVRKAIESGTLKEMSAIDFEIAVWLHEDKLRRLCTRKKRSQHWPA